MGIQLQKVQIGHMQLNTQGIARRFRGKQAQGEQIAIENFVIDTIKEISGNVGNYIQPMYLDLAVIFVVIQVFPSALFPVLRMRLNGSPIDSTCPSLPELSFLSPKALDTSFSLCSLQSWAPAGPDIPGDPCFPFCPLRLSRQGIHGEPGLPFVPG